MNLYPFAATGGSGASPDRAAAKNCPSVAVVVDPAAYADVLAAVRDGGTTLEQRKRFAALAFAHTAAYDVDVVAAAQAAGATLYVTGTRHFAH